MGIRDWLAIIVIIFIVLILLDGFRRKWVERKNRIVVKLDKNIPPPDESDEAADPLLRSELPNGGARTKNRRSGSFEEAPMRRGHQEDVPVLMESVDLEEDEFEEFASESVESDAWEENWDEDTDEADDTDEDAGEADDTDESGDDWDEQFEKNWSDRDEFDDEADDESDEELDEDAYEESDKDSYEDSDEGYEEDEALEDLAALKNSKADEQHKKGFLGKRASEEERIEPTFGDQELTFTRDNQGELNLEDNDLLESDFEDDFEEDDDEHEHQPHEVIIINVMAKSGSQIEGARLLKVLLRQGMRLGDMSIFHRHADTDGKGPVMFSMANMLKPGTFSMSEMESFTTPGVSFFMQLPNKLGNMHCFEQMLKTAEALKKELDVLLKDENRSVFTLQTIEHSRQRIRDFELEMLARK